MAGKYLGPAFDIHGGGVDLRFPHHENEQAQSRAAGRPFASYWMHNAWITTAGEKMSKSLGNSLTDPDRARAGPRHRAALLPGRRALPLARRVLLRGARRGGRWASGGSRASSSAPAPSGDGRAQLPQAFVDAMDDDLGTPAAVAVLYDAVREGNRLMAAGDAAGPAAPSGAGDARRARPRPGRPAWADQRRQRTPSSRPRVDALVAGLLEQRDRGPRRQGLRGRRRDPRPDQGGRHRDRGHPRRPEVDHRSWTPRSCQAIRSARASIRKTSKKPDRRLRRPRASAASRARGRRPRPRTGPTTRSTRPSRPEATTAKPARARAEARVPVATPSGSPGATRSSRRCARGVPSTACTSPRAPSATAGCARRSSSPPSSGISLLEVSQGELDRLTDRAVHQGLAARIPAYEYAHADDLLDRGRRAGREAADRRARLGHRPAQPRRRRPQRRRVRRARRGDPRAPGGRHDRVGMEDLAPAPRPGSRSPRRSTWSASSRPTRTPAAW